ncbi:MAG: hypothetical protein P3C09_09075 [Gemmatimonadota bacterium]|nr:hypothetical protein [Gemmatimonadota bacterium]MDQ8167899.1 hypothetical protein [Gemmatimonadota bacterium]
MTAVFKWSVIAMLLSVAAPRSGIVAQPLSANPAAVCAAPIVRDGAADANGVVVRFTAALGGTPLDALTAHALGARLSEELGALATTPVREAVAGADTSARPLGAEAIVRLLEAGERWVVSGDVQEVDDVVIVRWRVFDARVGREVGTGQLRDDLLWLPRLTGALLNAVGTRIAIAPVPLARTSARLRTRQTTSRPAMEGYLAALYDVASFDVRAQQRAIVALPKALALDSAFSGAWFALALAHTHAADWGDSATARGRAPRLGTAIQAANRALALDPADTRTLALLARIHLLRNEPNAAAQALAGLGRTAERDDDVTWLRAELARVRGDSSLAERIVRDAGIGIAEHVPTLFLRAEWERRRGRPRLACLALNRIIVLDETWAPAYVMRALVRSQLGDRRGGWADAEIVSRLGRPSWGEATAALIDVSMGDVAAVRRLARQKLRIDDTVTLPWLDALLRASVFDAIGDGERAQQVLAAMPCDDYRRRFLAGDPLLRFLRIPARCRVSRRPASTG